MKASELRIGNYIRYKTGFGDYIVNSVKEIHDDKIAISNKSDSINDEGEIEQGQSFMLLSGVQSIPLTDEWLIKAGFENNVYLYQKGTFVLKLEKYSGLFKLGNTANYSVELEHVHQLQNLYFALTGEDLTIKELV